MLGTLTPAQVATAQRGTHSADDWSHPLRSHAPATVRAELERRLTRVTEAVDDVIFLDAIVLERAVVGYLLAIEVQADMSASRQSILT